MEKIKKEKTARLVLTKRRSATPPRASQLGVCTPTLSVDGYGYWAWVCVCVIWVPGIVVSEEEEGRRKEGMMARAVSARRMAVYGFLWGEGRPSDRLD